MVVLKISKIVMVQIKITQLLRSVQFIIHFTYVKISLQKNFIIFTNNFLNYCNTNLILLDL